MHIGESNTIELLAPAKINLFLYVLGRRSDGYHDLYSLMCCVSLYDRLILQAGAASDAMTCSWADMAYSRADLACDDSNLVMKALAAFNAALVRETDILPGKVAIHLIKQIPMGAGLGGGSSDAAATLKGLNRLYGEPFGRGRLHAMALGLGADVPFFIDQRPALAEGLGERLTACDGLPPLWAVLVYPGFGLSTAQVFRNLNLGLTKSKKTHRNSAFTNGHFSASRHLHNDLEAGVGERYPAIARIKQELLQLGALGSSMTGSGSVVYGLYRDEAGASHARAQMGGASDRELFVARLLT